MSQYNNYILSSTSSNYTLSSSPPSSPTTNDDYLSTIPRSAQFPSNDNGPGMVVLPNGRGIFVDNKAAYFAENPAARASNEKSVRDFMAFRAEREAKRDREEKKVRERRERKDAELEAAGIHLNCVGGKVPATCRDCAGNGCAHGDAYDYTGQCAACKGSGIIFSDCDRCLVAEQAKKKGGWNRGRKAQAPACDEGGDVVMGDA